MIGFLLRALSGLMLASAVLIGVVDAIRSVAASLVSTTTVGQVWRAVYPSGPDLAIGLARTHIPMADVNSLAMALSQCPAAGLGLVLALLFWCAGYRSGSGRKGLRIQQPR